MSAGFTPPVSSRLRRRKTSLPWSFTLLDGLALFLLGLSPIVGPWIFGGNRLWIMGPLMVAIGLSAALVAYRFLVSPYRRDGVVPPGGWLLLGLVAYLAALWPFAAVRYDAAMEAVRFLAYLLAFWSWANLLRFHDRWKILLALLMLSASLMAWYALIQDVHGTRMVLTVERPEQYGMRASGAFICPNHFAHLMQMLIPVGIGVVACRSAGVALRLVAGYAALLAVPALYLTESRSGLIGMMAGLVTLAVAVSLRRGLKKFLLVLVIAPVLAAGVGVAAWKASPMLQERVALAMQGDIRLVIWKDSLPIFLEKPVFGHGLGSYRWMYPHYRTHLTVNADPEFAHNDYLHYGAEFGVVGLLICALIVLAVVHRALRIIRTTSDEGKAWLMAGLLGMIAGSLAHAFFDFNFHIYANAHVYIFLIAALFAAAASDAGGEKLVEVRGPGARRIGILLIALCLVFVGWYGRALVSYGYVLAAQQNVEKFRWDQAQAQYRRALAWAPANWRAHIGYAHLLRSRSFWVRDRALREQWLADARTHYEWSLAKNPWEVDAVYGLSGLYKMTGDQERALELRRKAVELVPRHVFYLNELGLQLKDMGRYAEALAVYQQSRAVESSPAAERNIAWLQARLAEQAP